MTGHERALSGLVVWLALSAGCAHVAPTTPVVAASGLPDWVLVVPPPDAAQASYVGGCAAAPDTATGIAVAEADARAQAAAVARQRIAPLVEDSFHKSGVETEALERARFRQLVVEPIVERLAGTLRRERASYRECTARQADTRSGICDVFILMTADGSVWERLPIEVLADLRKQTQSEAGDVKSAGLLDWIIRHYGDTDPGSQAGGRGSEGP